jgi:hypothetical protein
MVCKPALALDRLEFPSRTQGGRLVDIPVGRVGGVALRAAKLACVRLTRGRFAHRAVAIRGTQRASIPVRKARRASLEARARGVPSACAAARRWPCANARPLLWPANSPALQAAPDAPRVRTSAPARPAWTRPHRAPPGAGRRRGPMVSTGGDAVSVAVSRPRAMRGIQAKVRPLIRSTTIRRLVLP